MNPKSHRELNDQRQEKPTPEQLADQFVAQAVKTVLAPTPDGLDVLTELTRKTSKPTG